MHVLIIHPEDKYFAGAEKMLGYYLAELVTRDCQVAVAVKKGSRVAKLLPPQAIPIWIEANPAFSPATIWRQAQALRRSHTGLPFDIIHGWAARDWELAALTGWLCRRPAIGTLHDHPEASFISRKRRRLMRWCASCGLRKIICVSAAVKSACEGAGYPPEKLSMIHNGLPISAQSPPPSDRTGPCQFGFLGVISARKGLRELFQMIEQLSLNGEERWELHMGGDAQDAGGEKLLLELRARYQAQSWWSRVHWHGWVELPQDFLRTLDLLVVPSPDFDPFPTVLLEAGQAGVPALAARMGGAPEIIVDGRTGWLFEHGNVVEAARILGRLIDQPALRRQAGQQAGEQIGLEFSVTKMVAGYCGIYSTFMKDV
jgi:glycosyltransferase involved in cell wall biosynthesis